MLTFLKHDEEFKSFRKKYLVSNFGRVYSLSNNKFIKPQINQNGYLIWEEGTIKSGKRIRKFWYVHITVVKLFGDCMGKHLIKNKKLEIDHIDGDKTNNLVSNLELVTHQENVIRFYKLAEEKSRKIDQELFGLS